MPRPLRVNLPGALYYVTSRAAFGRSLFKDVTDYEAYLEFLGGYQRQFGFKLFAYALLGDELHLLLELAPETSISAIMHALNSRYTKHVTGRYGHAEHVFQERFHMTVMEKAPSLLPLTIVVHRLPQEEGLVAEARAYRWSSASAYLSTADAGVRHLSVSDTGLTLHGEVQEVTAHLTTGATYDAAMQAMSRQELQRWQKELEHWVVGSDAFRALVEQRVQRTSRPAVTAGPAQPVPSPRPTGPRWNTAPVLTGSLAVALLSLSAAGLYAKNLSALRQAMRAMAVERISVARMIEQKADAVTPAAQLASLTLPSRLAGTTWDVQILTMHAQSPSALQQDQLTFTQTQIFSRLLTTEGYSSSKYLVARTPEGQLVWETIQTNRMGEMVSWKGEWQGTVMRGTMTRQAVGQAPEPFTFVGMVKPAETIRSET